MHDIVLAIEHFQAGRGGAEQYAVRLFRQLAARDWRVTVLAADGQPVDGIEVVRCSLEERTRRVRELRNALVVDWGLTLPADLHRLGGGVHAGFLRLRADAAAGLPRLWRRLQPKLPSNRRIIERERRLLQRPQARILAVSRFVAEQVRWFLPETEQRLVVLHNGVDTRTFRPAESEEERTAARQRFGIPEDAVVFLFVANNLRLKNFRLLLRVFDALSREIPAARLVTAGNRKPLATREWLQFVGHTSDPASLYRSADVLVHPTLYDACSNAVLEALASGIPVVSSDRNGAAEVMADGRDGFVLPVAGIPRREVRRRWTSVIRDLAASPELRDRLGRNARNTACRHSFDAYVDRFEDLLRALPAVRNGPGTKA